MKSSLQKAAANRVAIASTMPTASSVKPAKPLSALASAAADRIKKRTVKPTKMKG